MQRPGTKNTWDVKSVDQFQPWDILTREVQGWNDQGRFVWGCIVKPPLYVLLHCFFDTMFRMHIYAKKELLCSCWIYSFRASYRKHPPGVSVLYMYCTVKILRGTRPHVCPWKPCNRLWKSQTLKLRRHSSFKICMKPKWKKLSKAQVLREKTLFYCGKYLQREVSWYIIIIIYIVSADTVINNFLLLVYSGKNTILNIQNPKRGRCYMAQFGVKKMWIQLWI